MAATTTKPGTDRTDAVRPELRWVGIVVLAVLLTASVLLYLFPERVGRQTDGFLDPGAFAWPVAPHMTAMFMGACYGAGAYFFWRVSFGGSWHAVAAYFPGIAVFTWLMGIATFVHWDRFNHDHVAFVAWLVLYVSTPLLVPLLYLRNRAADPGRPDAEDAVVPLPVRRLAVAGGAVLLCLATVMYVAPAAAIDAAPWKLTALTSRVLAAFLAAVAVAAVILSRDARWSAWRTNVRAGVVSAALLLVAAARAWEEIDTSRPATYAFLAAATTVCVGGIALDAVLQRRARAGWSTIAQR